MATPKTYSEKLRDPRWQKKRLQTMERDGFKCRDCGAKDKTLNVHHCHYARGEPWSTPSQFLLTLCEGCHITRGDIEADAKRALAEIFAKSTPAELADVFEQLAVVAEYSHMAIGTYPKDQGKPHA